MFLRRNKHHCPHRCRLQVSSSSQIINLISLQIIATHSSFLLIMPSPQSSKNASVSTPTPTPPPPSLPRAGTFRTARPRSFAATKRTSTFVSRPKSYAGEGNEASQENGVYVPRLRRAGSFHRRAEMMEGVDSVRLRRAGSFTKKSEGNGEVTLRRQGSFKGDVGTMEEVRGERRLSLRTPKAGEGDIEDSQAGEDGPRKTCGMCSGCQVGIKAFPLWAPERLKKMDAEEKETVLMELRLKEEKGRLERELRKKRLKDRMELEERVESKRGSYGVDMVDESGLREELESVDLGGERVEESKEVVSKRALEDGCGHCDVFEEKVKDLEEQLGVLREVVRMCGDEEEDGNSSGGGKKPKTWKDKVMSAYFGGVGVNEKARLKQEVDALRKATDFLFQKLQNGDKI